MLLTESVGKSRRSLINKGEKKKLTVSMKLKKKQCVVFLCLFTIRQTNKIVEYTLLKKQEVRQILKKLGEIIEAPELSVDLVWLVRVYVGANDSILI